jgi:hypothetical protein
MINIIDTQADEPGFPATKGAQVFIVDFSAPSVSNPAALEGKGKCSIVVRIESEDILSILNAAEPAKTSETFSEALAKQTALLAIEKDLPDAFELSLSAEQIDCIPAQFENRLPDFCMNGNKAWLV